MLLSGRRRNLQYTSVTVYSSVKNALKFQPCLGRIPVFFYRLLGTSRWFYFVETTCDDFEACEQKGCMCKITKKKQIFVSEIDIRKISKLIEDAGFVIGLVDSGGAESRISLQQKALKKPSSIVKSRIISYRDARFLKNQSLTCLQRFSGSY